ncbi:hypothetical protein O181_107816 [Austropuccinia psidii MF-1]|uniref:Uncharacterized protein n=1 Tax=Austropuccinia psidii MF-1 TaxID=1389203 RepID=A0A9Q3PPG8_9BASI|nr:hypothetical protein [Austropuccinia psidii MF-1]
MVQMKILKICGGELEHALRSRCIEPCSTEEYINALEDIVTRTKIGRTWKKLDIKSPNKPFIKKDKSKKAFKPNISNSNEQKNAINVKVFVTMLSARPQQRELLPKRLLNRLKDQLILASCRSHSTM